MRLKDVSYSVGMTVSTAPYESIRPGGSATVEISDGDDPTEALKLARKWALVSFVKASEDMVKTYDFSNKLKERFPTAVIEQLINEALEDMEL